MTVETMTLQGQLAKIVGKNNVMDSPEVIASYGRDHSIERPRAFTCVVRPGTAAETQKIIQLANELKFAVIPQSSGIHFNGNAIPKEGGVVLDLSGMNRITEIIEQSMAAHVQVGVTWEQLQMALEAKGLRCIIPLLPHASRSAIMDCLERERPVIQNYEASGPLRSLQIIWGNGELFVSGSASTGTFRQEGNLADGVYASGPGPMSYDSFFYGAQGTIGTVIWGVLSLEEIPTLSKAFFIPSNKLEHIIEPLYTILRRGVANECLVINNTSLATIFTEHWPEQFAKVKAALPPWIVIFISSALKRRPEEKIAYQEKFVRELASMKGLELLTTLPGLPAVERKLPEMLRKPWPKDKIYWKHAYKGGCQDIEFMTTLDRVEKFMPTVAEVAASHYYPVDDIGCYIQPVEDGHACQLQFSFYYDPTDTAETERIRHLYADAAAALLNQGAYFTEPYHMVAGMVYRKQGEYTALLRRFKKHFDPSGIMSPGNLCF